MNYNKGMAVEEIITLYMVSATGMIYITSQNDHLFDCLVKYCNLLDRRAGTTR